MAQIYQFPLHPAQRGGVYCKEFNVYFPAITRIVQMVSQADLDYLDIDDEVPGITIHYTARDEASRDFYLGTIECSNLIGMPDVDGPSLVIRHHANEVVAHCYLEALIDTTADLDTLIGEMCRTDQGIFTLAERERASIDPPVIMYLAKLPNGMDWYRAFAPDGSPVRMDDYEIPGRD